MNHGQGPARIGLIGRRDRHDGRAGPGRGGDFWPLSDGLLFRSRVVSPACVDRYEGRTKEGETDAVEAAQRVVAKGRERAIRLTGDSPGSDGHCGGHTEGDAEQHGSAPVPTQQARGDEARRVHDVIVVGWGPFRQ